MNTQLKKPTLSLTQLRPIWRYRVVLFVVFIAGLCSYLLYTIDSSLTIPASDETTEVSGSKTPRIDPATAARLQSLQDNSQTVQAIFNEARENPFQ